MCGAYCEVGRLFNDEPSPAMPLTLFLALEVDVDKFGRERCVAAVSRFEYDGCVCSVEPGDDLCPNMLVESSVDDDFTVATVLLLAELSVDLSSALSWLKVALERLRKSFKNPGAIVVNGTSGSVRSLVQDSVSISRVVLLPS